MDDLLKSGADASGADASPIFVYGALRSGTTVFRLMLDAHSGISNPGETDFMFDFLKRDSSHPTGWRYDLDRLSRNRIFGSKKLDLTRGLDGLDLLHDFFRQFAARAPGKRLALNIHRNADLLFELLPQAKVIHMLRDPRDVARSSIGMGWAETIYFGVDHWIKTEEAWGRAIAGASSPQVLTLTYEALFADTPAELRRVCRFIDVPFADDMLRYHETTSYGRPDPSLVGQWRRKCAPADVALLEGKAAALMRARGYTPAGPGRVPGLSEAMRLYVGQKMFVWRFGVRRHGALVYWGAKAARFLRLRPVQVRLQRRMNKTVQMNLK